MTLRLTFLALIVFLPTAAFAAINCDECNPWEDYCGRTCQYCVTDYEFDNCPSSEIRYSTCGEWGLPCLPGGCSPNWQEYSRENRGTYGEAVYYCWWSGEWNFQCIYGCDHHRVDWVTYKDLNECNIEPAYWYNHECQDYIDGMKGWSNRYEDCCDGFGPWGVDPTFTCNHYHSCW